uniref:Uncharacterized protein n=1 Tax=Fagus sylvatica TaxID=28930 RepID=A0A2N9ETQ3_FAGSY
MGDGAKKMEATMEAPECRRSLGVIQGGGFKAQGCGGARVGDVRGGVAQVWHGGKGGAELDA